MIRASDVEAMVDTRDVIERYSSTRFNAKGFARCPFHQEKTASFKVFNGRFKCFGCGASGGAIDFTMRIHEITFQQALVRLNHDFSLGLSSDKPSRKERLQAKENKRMDVAIERWQDSMLRNQDLLIDVRRKLWNQLMRTGDPALEEYINSMDEALDDTTGRRAWERWQIVQT